MKPSNHRVAAALKMYASCAGPFQTVLHWPYEGSLMDQPAVLVEFFELIRFFSAQKQEEKSSSSPQNQENSFRQRQRTLNKYGK